MRNGAAMMEEDIIVTLKRSNDLLTTFGNDYSDVFLPAIDEIEQLRKDKQLGLELMDVFIKEINRLKHMIAQYKLYDDGPYLDDNGNNLDGN